MNPQLITDDHQRYPRTFFYPMNDSENISVQQVWIICKSERLVSNGVGYITIVHGRITIQIEFYQFDFIQSERCDCLRSVCMNSTSSLSNWAKPERLRIQQQNLVRQSMMQCSLNKLNDPFYPSKILTKYWTLLGLFEMKFLSSTVLTSWAIFGTHNFCANKSNKIIQINDWINVVIKSDDKNLNFHVVSNRDIPRSLRG